MATAAVFGIALAAAGVGWAWLGNPTSDLYATWQLRHYIDSPDSGRRSLAWAVSLAIGRPVVARTHFYELELETVKLEPRLGLTGGAIERLGDRLLVATPLGRLAAIGADGNVEYLDGRVPMNAGGRDWFRIKFRVMDVLLREQSPRLYELFVSHLYFLGEPELPAKPDDCFLFRLSSTTLALEQGRVSVSPSWRTIYELEPCVGSSSLSGGRMLADGERHLLVSVGTFGDHWAAADLGSSLGKVLRIDVETGEAGVFTSGHRNPQGMARDAAGNVWATEHGPIGGDELNLLVPGRDYGWPQASYGLDIFGRLTGRHDELTRPVFAWAPSVGTSAVIVNDRRLFPLWRDDLLVASLWASSRGTALFRVRREGTEVKYVERIEIGHQIRDLIHMQDGRLALLLEFDRVLMIRPRKREYSL